MSFFNDLIVIAVQAMPKSVVGFFSKKYIAGETLADAVQVVKNFNKRGILATMDVLGESVKNKQEALDAKCKGLEVLNAISENKLNANLSVKLTQLGLLLDEEFCYQNVEELVSRANEINNFVRVDMEDAPTTDATFRIVKRLRQNYKNVGIVVQAYLKRTYDDVIVNSAVINNYRLCKGIYNESPTIAYKDKQQIRDNYIKVLDYMLKNGIYVGIATHDEYLIKKAYQMIKDLGISKDKFEFQMLLGVREDLRNKINNDGYKIRIYTPFGKDWYPYSIRRLKENPQMAGHIFRALFRFKK
ncbi:MAG: proline dehydrogenase family protein [Syntrophothermus sp.]